MLFNPVEDELITGGVGGTKVKISKNDGTPQGLNPYTLGIFFHKKNKKGRCLN
jgi:hypothetical protein